MELNTAGIAGTVVDEPKPYQNIYGRKNVYAFSLDIARDSGVSDRVLVVFQEEKVYKRSFAAEPEDKKCEPGTMAALIKPGGRVEVTGAIQTHKVAKTGRIQLFVWAQYIAEMTEKNRELNISYIKGEIAKAPIYRITPKKKKIAEFMVKIPSVFTPGYYSYIPCITWGFVAEDAKELQEGTAVYLEGRIQSREYRKRIVTEQEEKEVILTAWEVSISKMETEPPAGEFLCQE